MGQRAAGPVKAAGNAGLHAAFGVHRRRGDRAMSDLLSGLLGGARRGGVLGGGLGGGLRMAALALLLHQVMKRSGGGGAAPRDDTPGGGLGGLLGGLLGGGAGGPAGGSVAGTLGGGAAAGGGLGGLLSGLGGLLGGLRSQGLSQHVESWIATGPNQPVEPRQLAAAFDPDEVETLARKAGTDRETLMQEVSRVLPDFVDRMTPQGRLPQHQDEVGGGLGGLLGSLLGGQEQGPPRRDA